MFLILAYEGRRCCFSFWFRLAADFDCRLRFASFVGTIDIPLPKLDWSTSTACRNCCFSILPTSLKFGDDFQQVFNWQLPDKPWHLHWLTRFLTTTWEMRVGRERWMNAAQTASASAQLTIRPTLLLCRLICDWKSPRLSRESKNISANSTPKMMLCEHPAHFQPALCFDTTSLVFIAYAWSCLLLLPSLPCSSSSSSALLTMMFLLLTMFRRVLSDLAKPMRAELGSQPHDKSFPWLHARATLCTTPADAIAWPNALSR